jgi:hypothetical protein
MLSPTIFRTAGLLAGDKLGNVPIDFDTMKFWGYSYLAPQGVAGAKIVLPSDEFGPDDPRWKIDGLRPFHSYQDVLRAKGLRSIPWQKLFGGDEAAVRAQAEAAAEFVTTFRPDGFIVNPETEYKQEGSWRNKVYVDALLAALKTRGVDPASLVWGVAPLGSATPGNHFTWDIAQYQRLPGCFCMPEAYWTSNTGTEGAAPEYRPLLCADEWIGAHGWPADRFAFTLGWWSGNFATPDQYFADLALVKQKYPKWSGGFGVYLVEEMTTGVIAAFGQGVARGFAAAHEDAPTPVGPTPTQQAIALRDAARALLDDALVIYANAKLPADTIHGTRIYLADQILRPDSDIVAIRAALKNIVA